MRRKSSAADGRSESPAELIARISAEHDAPVATTGRHHRAGVDADAVLAEDRAEDSFSTTTALAVLDRPTPVGSDEIDPEEINTDEAATGSLDAVVTAAGPGNRRTARRLAPLAVGAVVMLVATTVLAVVRPAEDSVVAAPELSALVQAEPTTAPATVAPSLLTSSTPAPAPAATPARAAKPPTAAQKSTKTKKAAAPAPAAGGGDGTQAASTQGWTLVGGDEFNGSVSSKWNPYEGAGHGGNGRRTADAISVENGALVIRGDSNGTTGGMAWSDDQRFGKWEMRARFPRGDDQYHPVLLLWPNGPWPEGGEVDFAETTSASSDVHFFLHYGASNSQKYERKALDVTQWHNYAVEWVDGRITGYIDGAKWFESTDGSTMPPGEMHPTIQLDYFPDGGSPQPSEMLVDFMRIYK